MKKSILIALVVCMPLFAQDGTFDHAITLEGTIFEIADNQINFNETWMQLGRPQIKGLPALSITNAWDEPAGLGDLIAPCRVELTYIEHNKTFVPMKIKILEYYQYDDKGFILTTHN